MGAWSRKGRAHAVAVAVWESTAKRGHGSQRTSDGLRLVMTQPPELVLHEGEPVGVTCHVRLYDAATGTEIPIDPVRTIINPPTQHAGAHDPLAALWSVLWDSVTEHPAAEGWRP